MSKAELLQVFVRPPREKWPALLARPPADAAKVDATVREIFDAVAARGDAAVCEYVHRLDGVRVAEAAALEVPAAELAAAGSRLSPELRAAIAVAHANIRAFHAAQAAALRAAAAAVETMPGVRCWQRVLPIERVGLYVPGGTAPLFSSVLMLAVPAALAGCREVVLCTPPSAAAGGAVHPAVLHAAHVAGVTRVFRVGGAVAVAAMAAGTATVPRVDKICGPGNRYVAAAKQHAAAALGVAVDLPAGPSEVLVVADAGADPAVVAADLLSQAEHGPDSQVLLLTDAGELVPRVRAALAAQLAALPRAAAAAAALRHSRAIVTATLDEALELSNRYAPEHLILNAADARRLAGRVTCAGSVFVGRHAPESAGDYASGPNHTLPTGGHARAHSGVGVGTFTHTVTFQELSPAGLRAIAPTVEAMAEGERLHAHRNAVSVRLRSSL